MSVTALGDQAVVGKLIYEELDPPVSGGATPSLQQVCAVGNSTTSSIQLTGGNPITFTGDIDIERGFEDQTINIGYVVGGNAIRSVNIGTNVGNNGGIDSVNIGHNVAHSGTNQSNGCVAIGLDTGTASQGLHGVAIGYNAGHGFQGSAGVAIGSDSGHTNQGAGCVAIGFAAGNNTQGADSICIGRQAGLTNQPANSICLNSSGTILNNPATDSFCVSSIRSGTNPAGGIANTLWYDTTTKEIKYHVP